MKSAVGVGPLLVFDRIVAIGGQAKHAPRVGELRRAFEARTGAFAAGDVWFEARSRAFWTDAVAREGFGREVASELSQEERAWLTPIERAHRGLFAATHAPSSRRARSSGSGRYVLSDVWSGAELEVEVVDEVSREELAAADGQLFDGRVLGLASPPSAALLPGAVFHAQAAREPIESVLRAARERDMARDNVLDALLRMDRALRALSRVKPAYAYRSESLERPTTLRRGA
jgi:hypothetical protein